MLAIGRRVVSPVTAGRELRWAIRFGLEREFPQVNRHLFDRLIAAFRIFRERLHRDPFKLGGNFGNVARQRRRLSLKNRDDGVAMCGRRERTFPCDHFVDHHAQAPNI